MSSFPFHRHEDIHRWVWEHCKSLNQSQRDALEEIMAGFLGSSLSLKTVQRDIVKELRKLRDDHTVSTFEFDAIVSALKGLEA